MVRIGVIFAVLLFAACSPATAESPNERGLYLVVASLGQAVGALAGGGVRVRVRVLGGVGDDGVHGLLQRYLVEV